MKITFGIWTFFFLMIFGCSNLKKEIPPEILSEYNVKLLSQNYLPIPRNENYKLTSYEFSLGNKWKDIENNSQIRRIKEVVINPHRRKYNYYFTDGKLIKITAKKNRYPTDEYEYIHKGERIFEKNPKGYKNEDIHFHDTDNKDAYLVSQARNYQNMKVSNEFGKYMDKWQHIDTIKYNEFDQLLWRRRTTLREFSNEITNKELKCTYNISQELESYENSYKTFSESKVTDDYLQTYKLAYDNNSLLKSMESNRLWNGNEYRRITTYQYSYIMNVFGGYIVRQSYNKDNKKVGSIEFYLGYDNKINEIRRFSPKDYMYSKVKQTLYYN